MQYWKNEASLQKEINQSTDTKMLLSHLFFYSNKHILKQPKISYLLKICLIEVYLLKYYFESHFIYV